MLKHKHVRRMKQLDDPLVAFLVNATDIWPSLKKAEILCATRAVVQCSRENQREQKVEFVAMREI